MSTRDTVLAALKRAGDTGLSGEALAESLDVSRAAIAKHVSSLRADGYSIDAVPGKGYRLVECPDRLLPAEIRAHLASDFWHRIDSRSETVSTSDDCKVLARAGEPEGAVCLADSQSGGRGRLGREWASPQGGVYMSALLRPKVSLSELSSLPLVAALAVARAVEKLGAREVGVKWPNDVWLAGGKLAGILLEASTEGDAAEWVVIGIGLNISASGDGLEGAAYLSQGGGCDSRAKAAASVLDELAEAYARFRDTGFISLADEYMERSVLSGRDVVVREIDGRVAASGRVSGVDAIGRLILEADGAEAVVAAGDVTLRDSM